MVMMVMRYGDDGNVDNSNFSDDHNNGIMTMLIFVMIIMITKLIPQTIMRI